MFFADQEFMERFDIPLGVSCYGSTEVGGLSHTWTWRAGDTYAGSGGMSRYGGRPRSDVAWRLDSDGQILIRAERPGVLFSGYRSNGELNPALDDDGWFHTGDLGQVDEHGNLVFIERQAESIRVKGEFVPVSFVESVYARVPGLSDLAIGSRPSTLVDAELLLYVAGPSLPLNDLRRVTESLAPLMRPSAVLRVDAIPRDTGVGKVRRRQLAACTVLDEAAL
jgi:acyl-CoA synthetase (AMP-forming)/AMP-acid ligase II